MPLQNDSAGRGPWGSGARPGSDFEDLVRQGQDRLKQVMPTGGPRSAIVPAILALTGLPLTSFVPDEVLANFECHMVQVPTWCKSRCSPWTGIV